MRVGVEWTEVDLVDGVDLVDLVDGPTSPRRLRLREATSGLLEFYCGYGCLVHS
jgi:hypothetical protein